MPPVLSRILCLLLAACSLGAAGCATQPAPATDTLTFIVVRHAEKATDDPEDPSLSEAGRQRAQRLAERLAGEPLVAVYATEFRRTRQTAQPSATGHRLPVSAYYSRGPAEETAAQWRAAHTHGTVLVVGHSNTVPDLIAALSGQPAAPMADTEYDRLTRIEFGQGRPQVSVSRY